MGQKWDTSRAKSISICSYHLAFNSKSEMDKIKPHPPEQIPVAALVPPTVLPTMIKKLLDRLKEASTWAGLAIIAQFLPIGVEELQVIWEAITALAAVAAMLIPESKPEKEAEQG